MAPLAGPSALAMDILDFHARFSLEIDNDNGDAEA